MLKFTAVAKRTIHMIGIGPGLSDKTSKFRDPTPIQAEKGLHVYLIPLAPSDRYARFDIVISRSSISY